MTTTLDDEFGPELVDLREEVGTNATFRTYPSRTVDEVASEVTLGSPTDYVAKITPPEEYVETLSDDGAATQHEIAGVLLLTGNGTADAITFTPVRGMPVIWAGKTWSITKIEPTYTGDLIAAYTLTLKD